MTMTENDSKGFSILRLPQIIERTGLSKSTIYLHIQKGTFPKPIKLGERSVGWIDQEVDGWIDERLKSRNETEV